MSGVEVGPSTIEGLGLFATRRYPSGACIRTVSVVREITDTAPLRPDRGE